MAINDRTLCGVTVLTGPLYHVRCTHEGTRTLNIRNLNPAPLPNWTTCARPPADLNRAGGLSAVPPPCSGGERCFLAGRLLSGEETMRSPVVNLRTHLNFSAHGRSFPGFEVPETVTPLDALCDCSRSIPADVTPAKEQLLSQGVHFCAVCGHTVHLPCRRGPGDLPRTSSPQFQSPWHTACQGQAPVAPASSIGISLNAWSVSPPNVKRALSPDGPWPAWYPARFQV